MLIRRLVPLLACLPLLVGCELDLTGLDFSGWGGGGGGGTGYPSADNISGSVVIGDLPALNSEGVVLRYSPSDTITPADSTWTYEGRYSFYMHFGDPGCESLVRVRLWNGYTSELRPLLATVPDGCAVDHSWPEGASFDLPPYAPLAEPFTIQGRVFVDGRVPEPGEVSVRLFRRPQVVGDTVRHVSLETDEDGVFRYETTDAAVKAGFCMNTEAEVSDVTRSRIAWLNSLTHPRCLAAAGRTLPDTRLGEIEAVNGTAFVEGFYSSWRLGAGDAVVELIDPRDGSAIARTETLDDGSYSLWFPVGMSDPGCDWIVRLTHREGAQVERDFSPWGDCAYGRSLDLWIRRTTSGIAGPAVLTVVDPVGDHTGASDVVRMTMEIDAATGSYRIVLEADSAAPFQDSLRVNVNLYNVDANAFFAHTMDDRRIAAPTTELVLKGSSDALTWWRPGDRVHTNSLEGTPNPPGASLYRSSVTHFPMGFLTNEDVIAFEDPTTPAVLETR